MSGWLEMHMVRAGECGWIVVWGSIVVDRERLILCQFISTIKSKRPMLFQFVMSGQTAHVWTQLELAGSGRSRRRAARAAPPAVWTHGHIHFNFVALRLTAYWFIYLFIHTLTQPHAASGEMLPALCYCSSNSSYELNGFLLIPRLDSSNVHYLWGMDFILLIHSQNTARLLTFLVSFIISMIAFRCGTRLCFWNLSNAHRLSVWNEGKLRLEL